LEFFFTQNYQQQKKKKKKKKKKKTIVRTNMNILGSVLSSGTPPPPSELDDMVAVAPWEQLEQLRNEEKSDMVFNGVATQSRESAIAREIKQHAGEGTYTLVFFFFFFFLP